MLAELSIIPVGIGESLSSAVAKAVEVIHSSHLAYRINPMGTVIEGEWDEIMELVKRCHKAVRENVPRVIINMTIDDRDVSGPRLDKKIQSIEEKLGRVLCK